MEAGDISENISNIQSLSDLKPIFGMGSVTGSKPSNFVPARVLHVHDTMSGSGYKLTDTHGTLLYKANISALSGNITLRSEMDGSDIGIMKFHNFSSKMDATVRGYTMVMEKASALSSKSFTYQSPAYQGAKRTWKPEGMFSGSGMDLYCLDERGNALARFQYSTSSMTKTGSLELAAPVAAGGPVTEELILTALAMTQQQAMKAIKSVVGAVS